MKRILDAILAGDTAAEDFAALEIPQSYKAVTVHKDEVDMFEGLASRDKDPRGPCTWRTWSCPSSAPARPWSR